MGIEKDFAIIDVGLKTEGRIPVKEFGVDDDGKATLKVGDTVEVFLERVENALGEAVISREKARREEAWTRLEGVYAKNEPVMGAIVGRVKGGFTVDLGGASAFLPGSQVDIRPVRDVGPLMGKEQPFAILKMDRPRGNIVVSRRAILEEARAEQRTELVSQLVEGEVREGVVKNITDYGAFVDLGGIDGLLHVTDMSWKRVSHPSQVLAVGDTVKVQIVKINPETQRISLGMKQLQSGPVGSASRPSTRWATKFKGCITNITDYGAFVELEAGVEGLVHVSEMSWTKKNVHNSRQDRLHLAGGLRWWCWTSTPSKPPRQPGPQAGHAEPLGRVPRSKHPIGTAVDGEVKNEATEFGLFVGLDNDIDGMVHLSDIDWNTPGEEAILKYKKGEPVRARVLDVDVEKERISLGIKQLAGDPLAGDVYKKWPDRHRHRHRDHLGRHRGEVRRRRRAGHRLHPQGRPVARPRRAAPRALRRGRPARRPGHQRRQDRAPPLALGQGPRGRRGEAKPLNRFGSSDVRRVAG